jgi:calcium-dependent protein kinase
MGGLCSGLCERPGEIKVNQYFQEWKTHDVEKESQTSNSINRLEVPTRSFENIHSLYALDHSNESRGAFGKVVKARLRDDFSQMYAVKVIRKQDEFKDSLAMREIELLKKMDHPNIVKFKEVYEDWAFYYIVLEFLKGGDLQKQLEASGSFEEALAKDFIWQILLATNYLHHQKIVHGDLKPENFVLVKMGSIHIKMIDFGLSDILKNRIFLSQLSGSRFYLAPEVLLGKYTEKRDLWSIGVMLYQFLTGVRPFSADNEEELFDSIKRGHFDITPLEDVQSSPEVIRLVKGLLEIDPDKRLSAKQAIHHPWFADKQVEVIEGGKRLLTTDMLSNIRRFSVSSAFKRELIALLVQSFEDEGTTAVNSKVFFLADRDFSGVIEPSELNELFLRKGIILETGELDQILKALNIRNKHAITFLEFMIGVTSKEQLENEARLRILFKTLDTDKDGSVSLSDLNNCFARFGRCISRKQIESMITEADINNDRVINFAEFLEVMRG